MKDVFVIGGPNGAGKTTAANRLLPMTLDLHEFLNADEIARGAGLYNMRHVFLPLANVASIYDNSGAAPLLIAEKRSSVPFVARDAARWKLIEDATREELHG
jgi:predicted ABC-type ATPase